MATRAAQPNAAERDSKRQKTGSPHIVGWFRNDLRLSDNPMLAEVIERAQQKQLPSMLVYILDPRFYDASPYGRVTDQTHPGRSAALRGDGFLSRKCNGRRARFYLNVLRDLQRCLKELGTELHILQGHPEDVFGELSMQYGALEVVCLREPVSPEWTDVEKYTRKSLQKHGGSLTTIWGAMSLYHEDDIWFKFKEAPNSYTGLCKELGWKDIWTTADHHNWKTPIREPIPAPSGPWAAAKASPPKHAWSQELLENDKDALNALGFSADEIEVTLKAPHGGARKGKGGETTAQLRFKQWMSISATPEKDDPNFVCLGGEYGAAGAAYLNDGEVDPFQWKNLSTSAGWMQLSKYMACGCISPREMYHTALKLNHWALPGMCHRFMWREWHRMNALKYKTHLFRLQGPGDQVQFVRYGRSEMALRWKEGKTGIPYIDACMRELNKTGWLPYHKRKTVACFLSHDLAVDWRFGAFHFEEVLLDYDVAMNYGNWTFCARVDKPYGDRYTADMYRDPEHNAALKSIGVNAANDPNGNYIRQWCPELKDVPQEYIRSPAAMSAAEQQATNCIIGKDYPEPIITCRTQEELNARVVDCSLFGHLIGPEAWLTIANCPLYPAKAITFLQKYFKFPFVGSCFLLIVYMTGLIDDPNHLGKQLCIVCSHNIAIGYLFERDPDGIYVGFPHFGPFSADNPTLRILARFWSYEMVAIRFATALRPNNIPGLFASFMSLIIPQMAVFAPSQLGGVIGTDYFKNPVSFASVNGFPALCWLIYFLYRQLTALPATSWLDLQTLWVDVEGHRVNIDFVAIGLFLAPFLLLSLYTVMTSFNRALTRPKNFSNGGKTFLLLTGCFLPCYLYLLYAGWELTDVHKVMYGCASLMPIWWVNCLGGIDLWIEEPLGYPARTIAFTPTWIVSHGVFFLQWALDPSDYINRLVFILYMMPQLVYLNYYFRMACKKDWGTQLPILYSYLAHLTMSFHEIYKFYVDIQRVGIVEITHEVTKDCPLHFTPLQFAVFIIICTAVVLSPNPKYKWSLYSLCGPLNWLGLL